MKEFLEHLDKFEKIASKHAPEIFGIFLRQCYLEGIFAIVLFVIGLIVIYKIADRILP